MFVLFFFNIYYVMGKFVLGTIFVDLVVSFVIHPKFDNGDLPNIQPSSISISTNLFTLTQPPFPSIFEFEVLAYLHLQNAAEVCYEEDRREEAPPFQSGAARSRPYRWEEAEGGEDRPEERRRRC